MKVMITSSVERMLELVPHITVEAEYGTVCVKGTIKTLAHHVTEFKDAPAPCLADNVDDMEGTAQGLGYDELIIGVSHWDWDTVGGVLAMTNRKPTGNIVGSLKENESLTWEDIWSAIAYADVKGPHKLPNIKGWDDHMKYIINAMYSFSYSNRVFPDQGGIPIEINNHLDKYIKFLYNIALEINHDVGTDVRLKPSKDSTCLMAGIAWSNKMSTLGKASLIKSTDVLKGKYGSVQLRSSRNFTNHLYDSKGGFIIAFNASSRSILLSCSDGQINCAKEMQKYFGDGAGGKPGIAGTPRDIVYTFSDAESFYGYFVPLVQNMVDRW